MDHLMNTYRRLPIALERGKGVWLWDTNGNKYLDAFSGIGVTGLGHAHPVVTEAIQLQAAKLLHTSNLFQIPNQIALGDLLAKLSGLSKAFFCNSGAEAVEAALKLARLYGHQKDMAFPKIIVMTQAFHGRTLATISAGDNKRVQAGFEPLVSGFIRAPYDNISALETLAKEHDDIAAVLVEPIQGEAGIIVPNENYLKAVRDLCDKQDCLLILDEVQCGMGRSGTLFAYQGKHILPDVLTLAKGLANGVPIGACIAGEKAADIFKPGNHGSTFGGNPLATAAALATLETIESEKLWENAKKMGELLLKGLQDKLKGHPHVSAIRGQGLMIGIQLDRPCRDILPLALEKHLLFNVTAENVIRLLPPIIIEKPEIQTIIDTIPLLIDSFTA